MNKPSNRAPRTPGALAAVPAAATSRTPDSGFSYSLSLIHI